MKASDEAAFVEYAQVAGPRLRRTAYLFCHDWHRAEDATQDALTRLYVRWEQIDRTGGLSTYCHRVLVSVLLDQGKKPSRREQTVAPEMLDAGSVASHDEATVDRLDLMALVWQLPPRQRACLVLRYLDDLSVDEVAEVMRISSGTVKSTTARALTNLRQPVHTTHRSSTRTEELRHES